MKIAMNFPGQRIKHLRLESNLTRIDISEHTGISVATIKSWELNHRTPSKDNASKLVETFKKYGVSTSEDYILCKGLNSSETLSNTSLCQKSLNKALMISVKDNKENRYLTLADHINSLKRNYFKILKDNENR